MTKHIILIALLVSLCGLLPGQEAVAPQDDQMRVLSEITGVLGDLVASLKGIQDSEKAGKAGEYLPTVIKRLDDLEQKRVFLGNQARADATNPDMLNLEVERRILLGRIRKELDRIEKEPALRESLGDHFEKLATRFPRLDKERDPFEPSGELLERTMVRNNAGGRWSPARRNLLPQVALQGYVEDAKGNKIALLEVKDVGTFLVHEKDRITVTSNQSLGEIVIEKVDRSGVVLKTGMPPVTQVIR